ncbi:MAG: hypothetical protein MJ078_08735, partial [Clostridia bacterium]|nr:hypothetical protein [Clostridia bacterium]
ALTYSVTVDGEDSPYESISSDRFDLAEEDQALSAAILQNIRAIGEEFSFDLTLDIDKDGEDELCHYKAAVEAVVTENPIQIVATLPSDHFSVSSTQDEEMLALNGKTLTFSLIIDHSVAYQADTLETLRLKSLSDAKAALSYQNDEAADTAAYLDAFMAYAKETLISQRESQIKSNKETLVWQTLADKITDGKMPADAVKESYDELREQMRGEYMYYLKQNPSFVLSYPSVDYYVRSNYYPYDTSEYADYEDYLFSYVAPRQVFQKLLMYAIAENENLTLTKEEEDEAYNSYLDEQIAYYNASSQTVSREELVSYYGEDYIRKNTSLQRLSQKVSAFLLENNTLDETVSFYAD